MEITKEIIIPAQPEQIKRETHRLCDFCGIKSRTRCSLCSRDLCLSHWHDDPDDFGDYPAKYCPTCYKLKYETHRGEWLQIGIDAEDKYDQLTKRVLSESREHEVKT